MTYAPEAYAYDHSPNADGATDIVIDVPEYTLLQKIHTLNAILDTWDALYPHMQHIDLRRTVQRLEVPVYLIQGGHEMRGLAEPFTQWYEQLQAPRKHQEIFETAGHRAMFEQPDRFVAVMHQILDRQLGTSCTHRPTRENRFDDSDASTSAAPRWSARVPNIEV